MACQEAQLLLRGNASKPPCTEAKRKWSEYCCGETATDAAMVRAAATATASQPAPPGPDQQPSTSNRVQGQSSVRSTTEDTEAEEYGEEATPFCRSLCLKTDTKDWNMTCSELPEEECASTHFFETVGACERRLCVWAAPWKCLGLGFARLHTSVHQLQLALWQEGFHVNDIDDDNHYHDQQHHHHSHGDDNHYFNKHIHSYDHVHQHNNHDHNVHDTSHRVHDGPVPPGGFHAVPDQEWSGGSNSLLRVLRSNQRQDALHPAL
eukprot:s682_g15.t1